MPSRFCRTFTAEFKAKVVLDLLAGNTIKAEVYRSHQLSPSLLVLWMATFLERLPTVFRADAGRIAELDRLLGWQAMELYAINVPRWPDETPPAGGTS